MIKCSSRNNFDDLIKDGNVLVEFYTNSCNSCRLMERELIKIEDKIKIIKVDALESREIAKKYGIMSVPSLICFSENKNYKIKKGYMSSEDILEWILK